MLVLFASASVVTLADINIYIYIYIYGSQQENTSCEIHEIHGLDEKIKGVYTDWVTDI